MKKIAIAVLIILMASLIFCLLLNAERKDAARAFGDVIDLYSVEEYAPHRWRLAAPDETAWVAFDNMSIAMVVDADPFIAAGADLSKLGNVAEHYLNQGEESIYFPSPSFDMLNQHIKDSPTAQFEHDLKALRKYISFNKATGSYSLSCGEGNTFEWAQDINGAHSDIVFALNPEPLIAAGVDPENVEGWDYVQVFIEINGKTEQVWRFQKTV